MPYRQIHLVLWLIFLGYWIIKTPGNKKIIHRYNPAARLMFFLVTIFFAGMLYRLPGWPQTAAIPHSILVENIAVALCAAGVGIAIWARTILGRNWSANPTIKEGHELVTSGPYRYVRHPIYTGVLLSLFASLVLARGTWADVIMYAYLLIGLHFKAKVEEGLMLQTFPQAYPEYRQRTKAIIPFIL